MAHPDPELSNRAAAELAELRKFTRRRLARRLSRLTNGYIDPAVVRVLRTPPHEPPWQEVRLLDGIYVVFRRLAENERKGADGPMLLVGTITKAENLGRALAKLEDIE